MSANPESEQKPRLLFFFDGKDGRARRVEGFLAQVLQRRRNHQTFDVSKFEIGARPEIVERFGLTGEPTLIVVRNKRVQTKLVAPRGCEEIAAALAPWLR